ncbi:MAG: hypothetical protein ACLTOU_00205 [Acutalibacter sp.]
MKPTEITWTKATPQEAAGSALEHMKDLLEGLEKDFSTLKFKRSSRQEAEQFRQALAQARQEAAQEADRFFTWA